MRRSRWWKIIVAVALVLAVAGFQWTIWNPRVDIPPRVDAIFVLAYRADRQELGRELAEQGVSDNLVVSQSSRVRRMQNPSDPLHMASGEWFEKCDTDYPDYRAFCVVPEPNSTVGEAAAFARLAKEQGWESVLVVTERSHLVRAEMVMRRCYQGSVYGAASTPQGGLVRDVYRSVYEMGAFVKDALVSDCP